MEIIQKISLIFTIIGAIAWGILGLFDINIVDEIFRSISIIEKIIYIIVGICGLINIGLLFQNLEKE